MFTPEMNLVVSTREKARKTMILKSCQQAKVSAGLHSGLMSSPGSTLLAVAEAVPLLLKRVTLWPPGMMSFCGPAAFAVRP